MILRVTEPFVAGMPMPVLTDIAELRLDAVSFFLLLMILGTLGLRWAWNGLAKDFKWFPQLNIAQAFAVTILWGLLFLLVLTMISGARELMTPGAWVRNGQTYKLRETSDPTTAESYSERQQRMADLASLLSRWATNHERYPLDFDEADIPRSMRHPAGYPYLAYQYIRPEIDNGQENPYDLNHVWLIEPNVFLDGVHSMTIGGVISKSLPHEERDE